MPKILTQMDFLQTTSTVLNTDHMQALVMTIGSSTVNNDCTVNFFTQMCMHLAAWCVAISLYLSMNGVHMHVCI